MSFAPPLSASERALRGQGDMHPAAKLASASMGWSAKLRQAEEAASAWRATSKLQVNAPPPSSSARSSVAPPRSGTSSPRRQSVATPREPKEKASGRAPSRASSQSRLEGEGAAPTQDALTASQRSLPQGGAVWSAIQQAKAAVKPHISDERPRPPSSGRTTPRTSAPRPTSSGGPYSNKVAVPPGKGGPAGMSSRSGSAAAQFSAAEMATAQASALVEAGKCFKAERDALHRELAAVKEELRETAGRSARELAAAKDESRSLSAEAVEAAKRCDSLSRAVQEATQRAEAAERSAVGASSEAQDLGRQIVELAERHDAAESLRTECDELRQSLAQAQAGSGEEESLRSQCDELRKTLALAQAGSGDEESLWKECDELRQSLAQAQASSGEEESLRTECDELRQSLAQALARGGEEGALRASLAAAQSDRESLRTECDALRASLAAAQSNVEALQELKLHQEQQEEQLQQERRLREQQQEQLQQEQELREQLQEQLEQERTLRQQLQQLQEQFRLQQLQGQPQTPQLSFSAVAACVSSPSAAEEELKRGLRLAEVTAQGLRDEREQLRQQLAAVTEQLGDAGTYEASVRAAKPPAAPRPAPRRRRLAALVALLLIGLAPAAHKVASGEPLGLPSRQDLEGALRRSGAGLEEGAVRLQGSLRSSAAALEGGLPEEIRGAARRVLEGFPALHQLPGSAGRGSAA